MTGPEAKWKGTSNGSKSNINAKFKNTNSKWIGKPPVKDKCLNVQHNKQNKIFIQMRAHDIETLRSEALKLRGRLQHEASDAFQAAMHARGAGSGWKQRMQW
jgi:hypothetical protein